MRTVQTIGVPQAGGEAIAADADAIVVALKSLNGILIPATLKYAGNLVYLYAKPTSIVMTALASAVYSSTVPPASFCAGAALVIWSMANFKK